MITKKIVWGIVFLTLLSCDSEEVNKKKGFYDHLESYYELRVATIDPALDINADGVAHTDLYKEAGDCVSDIALNSYSCTFTHTEKYDQVNFNVPNTVLYEHPSFQKVWCFYAADLAYNFKVNIEAQKVMLAPCDWCEDLLARYYTKILDIDWEKGQTRLKLKKRFQLPTGEKKWVILRLKFLKINKE